MNQEDKQKDKREGIYQPGYTYTDPATGARVKKRSAVWWISYYVDGKKVRESSGSTNIADARRLRKQRLARKWQGQPVGPDITRTRLADLTQMVIDDYRANGRKLRSVTAPLKHLLDYFGRDCRALDVTTDRITAYIADRQEAGAAPATINRSLSGLKRGFTLAERAGKVAQRPYVPMLHEDNRRTGFFEADQFRAVLDQLPDYLRPVIHAAYVTGWRLRSEILTRQKHHIDLDAGWFRLDPGEGKSGDGRMFPLTPELRAVLEDQVQRTHAFELASGTIVPWLFHHEGKPIGSFRKTWISACERAGVPGRIPHDFRRTAVRNLERAGVPRSAAMAMVGHKTQSVYSRYAIADESMLRDGATKLAALHQADSLRRPRKVIPIG